MSWGGWLVLSLSVGAATLLFAGCIICVLLIEDKGSHMTGIDLMDPGDDEEDAP